jgi:DNA-binding NtrC family response regulator
MASAITMENARKQILLINGKSETSLLVGLEQEGYEVTFCESPQKAWGFLYPSRPDLIILHLHQPSSKDIYEYQECRTLADGVPVLIAANVSTIGSFTKELEEAAPPLISLPLKPDAVRDVLRGLESSISGKRA